MISDNGKTFKLAEKLIATTLNEPTVKKYILLKSAIDLVVQLGKSTVAGWIL